MQHFVAPFASFNCDGDHRPHLVPETLDFSEENYRALQVKNRGLGFGFSIEG